MTLKNIQSHGGNGALLPFDVTDRDGVEQAVKQILQEKKRIDILISNAGIRDDRLLVRMKPDSWQQVLDIHLTGFYNLARPVVRHMLSQRYGRIVTLASASGQAGQAGQVNYSAAKAGLIGATKALAREVATRNITVNAVSPGFIQTKMTNDIPLEQMTRTIPAGRIGTPEEVAFAVGFLCSQQAGYITGQVLGVNGGLC
jgi:3-oxoacyl-[acyl-carrier protein] reductase